MASPPTVPDAKEPHPVDVVVGRNLRTVRKRLGASQGDLAQALRLTFQQVQKYENGANRISASKLYEAAHALGLNVEDLYTGLPGHEGPPAPGLSPDPDLARLSGMTHGLELARAFSRISNPHARRLVVQLATELARGCVDASSSSENDALLTL